MVRWRTGACWQDIQAFDITLGLVFGAGDGHPAGAEAGDTIGLGQAVEGQAEHVWRQRGGGDVHRAVIENLVVDLVGEQHQLVLASQLHHAFRDFLRIDRAGGVVR